MDDKRKLAELCGWKNLKWDSGVDNDKDYWPAGWYGTDPTTGLDNQLCSFDPFHNIEQAMMVADTFEEWYAGKNDAGEYYCRVAKRGVSGLLPECLSYLPPVRAKTLTEAICRAALSALEEG